MSRFFWGGETPPGMLSVSAPAQGVTIVYKTVDETINNSATFQADNHLITGTLGAGKKYRITAQLTFTDGTAAQAGGIKLRLNGTATFTNFLIEAQVYAVDLNAEIDSKRLTAFAQSCGGTGSATPVVRLEGAVEVDAEGTFLVQWAQQVATSGDLTALRGSHLTYQEII